MLSCIHAVSRSAYCLHTASEMNKLIMQIQNSLTGLLVAYGFQGRRSRKLCVYLTFVTAAGCWYMENACVFITYYSQCILWWFCVMILVTSHTLAIRFSSPFSALSRISPTDLDSSNRISIGPISKSEVLNDDIDFLLCFGIIICVQHTKFLVIIPLNVNHSQMFAIG